MTDEQGTVLPTENKLASEVDAAISSGAGAAETAIEKAAETSEPALNFPVLKQLFEFFVHWILGVASSTGQVLITFGITRTQAKGENTSLIEAEKKVQSAIQSGDQNAIAQAEQDFQKAQSAASNSDGSAHPQ